MFILKGELLIFNCACFLQTTFYFLLTTFNLYVNSPYHTSLIRYICFECLLLSADLQMAEYMQRNTRFYTLIFVGFSFLLNLVFLPSIAQTTQSISLEEAITLGLQNSKTLQVSRNKIELIQNRMEQMKNLFIPNINLSAQYNRLSDNITPFTVQLAPGVYRTLNPQILNQFSNRASISYNIFNGFRLTNTEENIKCLEQAIRLDADKDKLEIKYNIIQAYYQFLKLVQSKKYVENSIEQANARWTDITNFQKNGMALEIDVMKASLNKSNLETSLQEIETSLEVSNYSLDLLLGLNTSTKLVLNSPNNFTVSAVVADDYLQMALKNRIELQALDARKKAAEFNTKVVSGNAYPVITVGGNGYLNNPNQRVFPNEAAFKGTWDLGASVTWNPTLLYTNKTAVTEAKLNTFQLQLNKDILLDAIKQEVYSQYKNYKLSLLKIDLANKAKLYAMENVRVLKNKVDNHINVITDLLDGDIQLLQAEINVINASIDASLAYQKLIKTTGE